MTDPIERQVAIEALESGKDKTAKGEIGAFYNTIIQRDIDKILILPSAQKTGNWTDKSIFYGEEGQIDMWQTCQCSECGRWDTRPYMYYFDEPNYCSYCGAKRNGGIKE